MKKTAFLLLLIFALVQAGPAVATLFSSPVSVFMVDEEKGEDNLEKEQKDKKDITCFVNCLTDFSHKINIAIHLAEKKYTSPSLEKLTPPPNFC